MFNQRHFERCIVSRFTLAGLIAAAVVMIVLAVYLGATIKTGVM